MKKNEKRRSVQLFILFLIIVIITLLPLALLFVASLRPGAELMRNGLNFKIDWAHANFDEYKLLFSGKNDYFVWYKNSLVITVVQTALSLFLSAWVAYGFAMYEFRFKNLFFVFVLMVMMVPTEVILLPLYKLTIRMHLINSMWGIILPYVVVPMMVFFFRQYLSGLPKELIDAARVDGCSEYGIFFKRQSRDSDSRRKQKRRSEYCGILYRKKRQHTEQPARSGQESQELCGRDHNRSNFL